MKFNKCPWPKDPPQERTPRRVAAAARAVQRERDSVALFPDLARYKTTEERLTQKERRWDYFCKRMRADQAATWRKARKALRQLSPAQREAVLKSWNHPTWHPPREAHYLADMVHTYTRSTP